MIINNNRGRLLLAASALSVFPSFAFAAGYALNEQSASAMGAANAGAAADPENASTVFFNPAGMTQLKGTQISFGAAVLNVRPDFQGSATNTVGQAVSGGDGGKYVPLTVIPNFYVTHRVNDYLSAGFGVHAPFGLKGNYDDDFVGRYFGDKTEIEVIDFQPSIAIDTGQHVSLGFGLDIMRAKGTLTKFQDYTGLEAQYGVTPGTYAPGYFKASGDDWGLGWNAGILFQPFERTSVGITYRSRVEFTLRGNASLSNVPNPLTGTTSNLTENAKVPLTTPDSMTFSLKQGLSDSWDLLAGATWTDWSRFPSLPIYSAQSNAGQYGTISFLGSQTYGGSSDLIGYEAEHWHNTWAFSIGTAWQATQSWKFKAGYAYDESPIPDEYRNVRVPSTDRNWLTLGAQWKDVPTGWTVDGAFGYLIMRDSNINEVQYQVSGKPVSGAARVQGTYKPKAWGLAVQVSKAF